MIVAVAMGPILVITVVFFPKGLSVLLPFRTDRVVFYVWLRRRVPRLLVG